MTPMDVVGATRGHRICRVGQGRRAGAAGWLAGVVWIVVVSMGGAVAGEQPGPEIDAVLRAEAQRALTALVKDGRSAELELKVGDRTITGAIVAVDKDGRLVFSQHGHKTLVAFAELNVEAFADLLLALIDADAETAGEKYLTASCLYTLSNQTMQATRAMARALELDPGLSVLAKERMEAVQAWRKAHAPPPPPPVVLPAAGGTAPPPTLEGGGSGGTAGIPKPAPLIATGAWAGLLKSESHPRLLGGPAFVQSLAKSKAEWSEAQSGEWLLALGLRRAAGVATPAAKIRAEIDETLKDVAGGVTNVHQDTWVKLNHAALVYDFFYADLSAAERQKIIAWINGHLGGKFTIDEGSFHNSTQSKIMTYLHIAYATWGENPRAAEFRDYALNTLWAGKVAPVLETFGREGGLTECGWYTHGSLWNLVQGLELARRFEKADPYRLAAAFFYRRLGFALHQGYPGAGTRYAEERFPMEGDGAQTYGGWSDYSAFTRMVLAQYYRGSPWARYIAWKRHLSSNPHSRTAAFFWEETPDPPSDPAQTGLSKAWLAAGIGRVYARDGWGPDATWLRFECGDWFSNHQHFESGNFEIFRHAPLATESGEYVSFVSQHSVNWLQRTIAHNTLLVYQPDEIWKRLRDGGDTYANDGGQNKKFDWTVDNLEEWLPKKAEFEQGDITAFQSGANYCYMAGDCTAAYAASKLQMFVRQIVFVHPGMFVIYDRVVSTRADYAKTWLLHCHNAPEIAGNTVTITAGSAPNEGRLICKTVLPEKAKIEKIEGYGYRGKSFPEQESVNTPLANKWRVEVSPVTAAADDIFLHVLTTTGSMPETKLVRSGGGVGVALTTVAGPVEVVFAGKIGGTLTINGTKQALEPKVAANADPR